MHDKWSSSQLRILKKQYPIIKHTGELPKLIGKSKGAIKSKVCTLCLRRQVPNSGTSTVTPAEELFIRDNYLKMGKKTMADKLNRSDVFVRSNMKKWGLKVPKSILQKFIDDARIKPGHIPMNKGLKQEEYMSKETIERTKATRFKKGQKVHNELWDGAIVIRKKHPNRPGTKNYKWIRLAKGNWRMYHVYKWEKKNGKLPPGKLLRFKDGNQMNCTLKNLQLITLAKNMQLNTIHRYPTEVRTAIRRISKLNKIINNAEK